MSASKSNLSSQKYGYDFVVASTQASINSGLLQYLSVANEPPTYLCFLADEKGNPTKVVSLEDLLAETGGVNPFEVPADTPYDDPRITALTKNMFVVGLQLQLGLPPGIAPTDLPEVVDLGSSASAVRFNLLCSQFTVIENSPPSGFGSPGSWNVWSQPSGTCWYFSTSVDLVTTDLDLSLDTPYFDRHPAQKQAILDQVDNLSDSAFSLEQLLFDLDNAAVESTPTIKGLPAGSDAASVLTASFVDLYFQAMKAQGEPVLSVHAVAQTPDHASLRLTALNREVNPYVDSTGVPIADPTPQQRSATTLDLLCAANGNPLPGSATFGWNWVDASDLDDQSGVLSVNRLTLANWLYGEMLPTMQPACLTAATSVDPHPLGNTGYGASLSWNSPLPATPKAVVMDSSSTSTTVSATMPLTGPEVLAVSYANESNASGQSGLTSAELDLHPSYTCNVSFAGTTITIVQRMWFWMNIRWDDTSTSGNIVDRTVTQTMTLGVTQDGELAVTAGDPVDKNDDQDLDFGGFVDFFVNLNDTIDGLKAFTSGFTTAELTRVPATDVQSFVFPGAQTFTYTDVGFSDTCDLVTAITYAAA